MGVDLSPDRLARRQRQKGQRINDFAIDVARLCHDRHCEDVLILDVREHSEITDYIMIASGTSDRQIKAVGDEITDLGEAAGHDRFGTERDEASIWLVLDFVDLIVHLFEPKARAHYDLEMMWNDAPQLPWQR